MSVNIFHKTGSGTGTLQKVAGNTVILDATTSEKRDWTVLISCTANTYCTGAVTFDVPMPDTDYCVLIETCNHQEAFEKGWTITNKSVNGFTLQIYASAAVNATFTGYAFKLITMDGYTELQNKVENPDNMPTKDSNNLVKSGGVWEALKDAGTVFTGTKSEWENLDLTEQERYEVVCITDDEESGIVDEYSTTETKTNKVWVDGKPIYRKTFITTSNFTASIQLPAEIDTLVSVQGVGIQPNNTQTVYPYTGNTTSNYDAWLFSGYFLGSAKTFMPQFGTSFVAAISKLIMTFEYTKTN